jgi:hypothetical protein
MAPDEYEERAAYYRRKSEEAADFAAKTADGDAKRIIFGAATDYLQMAQTLELLRAQYKESELMPRGSRTL